MIYRSPNPGMGAVPLVLAGAAAASAAGAYLWPKIVDLKGYFGIVDTLPNNPKLNQAPIAPGYGNVPESVAREEMYNWNPDRLAAATIRQDATSRQYEQYMRDISSMSGNTATLDGQDNMPWMLIGIGVAGLLLLTRR